MTVEELKVEAKKLGYRIYKIPDYDCSCYLPYPNKSCKRKDGKWKCVDKYEPVKHRIRDRYGPITQCKRRKHDQMDEDRQNRKSQR